MGGPIYEAIVTHTATIPVVRGYFDGTVEREAFRDAIAERPGEFAATGMSPWWLDLLSRMPPNDLDATDQLLDGLQRHAIVPEAVRHDSEFERFRRRVATEFTHLSDRFTSIFPEEGRAAFELSTALEPRRVVVAGSYYGYLAVWLIPGLHGRMRCIDPDPVVSDLAARNMANLGVSDRVEVICDDAVAILGRDDEPIDLLVVDAYGSAEHPDPDFHGKSIYGPILEAALPRLGPGAVVLAHNANRGSRALERFYRALEGAKYSLFLDTTEHLAVFGW